MCKYIIVIALFFLNANRIAAAEKDVVMQPIDQKTLVQSIQSLPLKSPQQGDLIGRAYTSGLIATAYEQYTLIWQKSPQDAYANLRRGQAAEDYWEYATRPDIHELSGVDSQSRKLFQAARECLTEAQKRAPNDASANYAYGRFLFWNGGQMSLGLSYMKKAVAISPKSCAAHETLGDAYAEHSGTAYNLPQAEKELKIAAMLDPTAAFPHWRLIRVYLDEKRQQDAKRELQAYISLTPPSAAQTKVIKYYQSEFSQSR